MLTFYKIATIIDFSHDHVCFVAIITSYDSFSPFIRGIMDRIIPENVNLPVCTFPCDYNTCMSIPVSSDPSLLVTAGSTPTTTYDNCRICWTLLLSMSALFQRASGLSFRKQSSSSWRPNLVSSLFSRKMIHQVVFVLHEALKLGLWFKNIFIFSWLA